MGQLSDRLKQQLRAGQQLRGPKAKAKPYDEDEAVGGAVEEEEVLRLPEHADRHVPFLLRKVIICEKIFQQRSLD